MGRIVMTGLLLLAACRPAEEPCGRVCQERKRIAAEEERSRIESAERRREKQQQDERDTADEMRKVQERIQEHDNEVTRSRSNADRDVAKEKLRASCAADRDQRAFMRRRIEEQRAKEAKEKADRVALSAYIKKNCKRRDRAVPIDGDGLEWDDDGYLRRERGVAVEVVMECPANGPPGARGTITMGTKRAGNDTSRIARLPDSTPSRDEVCRDADIEATKPN